MRIKDVYYIDIDFDGDISSKVEGTYIFTTLEEVKFIVKIALIDLEKKCPDWYIFIDTHEVPLREVIEKEEILEEFIKQGGESFGNWYINCEYIEEK